MAPAQIMETLSPYKKFGQSLALMCGQDDSRAATFKFAGFIVQEADEEAIVPKLYRKRWIPEWWPMQKQFGIHVYVYGRLVQPPRGNNTKRRN